MGRSKAGATAQSSVLAAMDAAARRDGFRLDPPQQIAVERLADLASRLSSEGRRGGGIYLWGPVGRGKTWLLDSFFESLPQGGKRFHLHGFFRQFHETINRHGIGREGAAAALDELVSGAALVGFDELYAHEPGDATLLTRVLHELIVVREIALVITSNYPPDGLLRDAEHRTSSGLVKVSHRVFEPGIALIKDHLEVVSIDDGRDYRALTHRDFPTTGFRSGRYLIPGTPEQLRRHGLVVPTVGHASIDVGGRLLHPRCAAGDTIWFDFPDLCGRPLSAADVVGLAARYRTWVIAEVPPLSSCSPEAAQRFVNFIDVLHDADARLIITSGTSRDDLIVGSDVPPDAARAASRLQLLVVDDVVHDAERVGADRPTRPCRT